MYVNEIKVLVLWTLLTCINGVFGVLSYCNDVGQAEADRLVKQIPYCSSENHPIKIWVMKEASVQ